MVGTPISKLALARFLGVEKLAGAVFVGRIGMPLANENTDIAIVAASARHIAATRELIAEYGASLGVDLSYQNFAEELASLPGAYAPPRGALLIAEAGTDFVGCIAMRPLSDHICEMKRLYVRPQWRATGLGRRLALAILDQGRRAGYRAIRLDTLPSMTAARALYLSLGFRAVPPYYPSPVAGTAFLEFDLASGVTQNAPR